MDNAPNNQKRNRREGPHRYREGMPIGNNPELQNIRKPIGSNTAHVGRSKYVKTKQQIDFEKNNARKSKTYNPNANKGTKRVNNAPMHGKRGSAAMVEQPVIKEGNAVPAMPLVPPVIEPSKGKAVSVANATIPMEKVPNNALINEKRAKRITFTPLTFVIIIGLFILSACLSSLRFKVPFLPSFLEVDFSIVPEYIGVVFFGPIAGTSIVLLKNITHMIFFWLEHGDFNYVSELSNFVTDFTFIFFAYVLYVVITNNRKANMIGRIRRVMGVFGAGTGSAIITAFAMLPFHYFLIYPMFVKYFANHGIELNIFAYYTEKMNSLDALWKGMLIFNLPWEFGKLFLVTLLSTGCYYIATLNEEA